MRTERNITVPHTIWTCDRCKREVRIKVCPICYRDVCSECAVRHDDMCSYEEENTYVSDSPSYICRECWDKGKRFREGIQQVRSAADNSELALMKQWQDEMKQTKEN